jgi:hypothetical protein
MVDLSVSCRWVLKWDRMMIGMVLMGLENFENLEKTKEK